MNAPPSHSMPDLHGLCDRPLHHQPDGQSGTCPDVLVPDVRERAGGEAAQNWALLFVILVAILGSVLLVWRWA